MNDYSHKSVSYVDPGGRILYLREKCSRDEKIKFIGCVPTIVRKSSWDRVMDRASNVLESLKDLAKLPYPSYHFKNMRPFYPFNICNKLRREGKVQLMTKFRRFG